MWIISRACRSRKAWPETRPNEFLVRWLKPDCLFTRSPALPEARHQSGISTRRGRLSEYLVVGLAPPYHVASPGGASEDESSSLVGHFTFRALVWGELLTTFTTAYAFSQRGGRQGRRLWVAVIQELRVAASLIFLAHRDLSVLWCPEVSLFDASTWVVR